MVVWLTNVTRVMLQRLVAFGNWYDLQIQARAFLCEAADTRDLYCIYIYIIYICNMYILHNTICTVLI